MNSRLIAGTLAAMLGVVSLCAAKQPAQAYAPSLWYVLETLPSSATTSQCVNVATSAMNSLSLARVAVGDNADDVGAFTADDVYNVVIRCDADDNVAIIMITGDSDSGPNETGQGLLDDLKAAFKQRASSL